MSVFKNYLYNLVYQILLIILPIITVPYITRVLGSQGVGINALTNANIQYFILFGTLGISLYGNRTIAYVRNDKEKLSNSFWSIFVLKLITTSIAYVAFIIIFALNKKTFTFYYWLQSINIISAAVDISWLFIGLEDFKKTVTRNLIIKIISVVAIFTLIKKPADLWLYIFISALSSIVGQAILWLYVPNILKFGKISLKDIKKHIIPSVKLFIPTIATQIYCVFDKSLLGYLSSSSEVGYYDMGQKIVNILMTVVGSMGTVMLPHMTNEFSKGNNEKINDYLSKTFNFASYLSIPMMFGLISISRGFSVWFFGKEFLKSGTIMMIESPILIFIGWSNVIGMQYMLPLGKSNEFTFSVTVGAIVDIISNLFLVKPLASYGAAISTVLAELSVTVVQVFLMWDSLPFKEMFKDVWKYLLSGTIMYMGLTIINKHLEYNFAFITLRVIIGGIIYFAVLIILKSDFQNKVLKMLKEKVFHLQ